MESTAQELILFTSVNTSLSQPPLLFNIRGRREPRGGSRTKKKSTFFNLPSITLGRNVNTAKSEG